MDRYYYTLSSLPMLRYEMEKPIPIEEFLRICRSELSEPDFRLLERADLRAADLPRPGGGMLERWWHWERTLRNELARLRAQRKGLDAERYLREADYQVGPSAAAREALGQETPLAAEEVLNRARWSFLAEIESGHFFDIDRLIVYYLRLQILHRKAAFNREGGASRFEEKYRKIAETIVRKH